MKYIIYGLTDPDTQEIRYIGKSTSGLKRPAEHKKPRNLKIKTHKTNWINLLISNNKTYGVIILEETKTPEELNEREIYWISEYKNRGARLTNSTDGGEGAVGMILSNESKDLIRQKRIEFHKNNPEVAKKLGESQRKQHININGIISKKCSDCGIVKSLTEYGQKTDGWDGHNTICKECKILRTKKYRELNPTEKLSEDEWKDSYKTRKEAMSAGAKAAYDANPELKTALSKKKSKAITGTPVISGIKQVEFESALVAYKEAGFNNTYISQAIKSGKPYKGYIWRFK